MWLDTHCHLDATEFEQDLSLVLARAAERGVRGILIPVVQVCEIEKVVGIVEQWHGLIPYLSFTLGIHPSLSLGMFFAFAQNVTVRTSPPSNGVAALSTATFLDQINEIGVRTFLSF